MSFFFTFFTLNVSRRPELFEHVVWIEIWFIIKQNLFCSTIIDYRHFSNMSYVSEHSFFQSNFRIRTVLPDLNS